MDGTEPETGKVNREWLAEEIADVLANAELNIARFGLDREMIEARRVRKMAFLSAWHGMLDAPDREPPARPLPRCPCGSRVVWGIDGANFYCEAEGKGMGTNFYAANRDRFAEFPNQ